MTACRDCHPDLTVAARACRRCAQRLAQASAGLWAHLAATVPAPASLRS